MKRRVYTLLDNCYTLQGCITSAVQKFNKKVKEDYHHMARIASNEGVPSLSAGQIGSDHHMFIMLAPSKLVDGKWSGYNANPKDYDVYANAVIEKHSVSEVVSVEECVTVPGVKCRCKRHQSIKARWSDEKDNEKEEQITGFRALIWQHEIDHLRGKLIVDQSVCFGEIQPLEKIRSVMSDRDLYEIHRLKESIKESRCEGGDFRNVQRKYHQLLQEIKYSIMERATQTK